MDLRTLRASLGLSQPKFARLLGTPYHTYRGWETGHRRPPPCVAVLCAVIEHAPGVVLGMLETFALEREAAARPPEDTLPAPPDAP